LFTLELGPKRLGLLFELAPKAVKVAALVNPTFGGAEGVHRVAQAANRPIEVITARNEQEIDAAFTTIAQMQADAQTPRPHRDRDGGHNARELVT